MNEPRYKHDCDEGCVFVGHLGDDDIWYHDFTDDWTEVILRHSSDGPDYGCWSTKMDYPMVPESYQRAIALVVKHKVVNT